MSTKYQVFVSSTYEDLKAERDQVIKAILEMGHIPVGMEMFSAADEQQWEIIKRQIDQSDYYVVIIAHRYGSVEEEISYTEKEYDYAVSQGVPVLGFIIDGNVAWPPDRMEDKAGKKAALTRFKEKVKRKPVDFWTSAENLHGKCSIALIKAITAQPRTGWARASEVAGPEIVKELSRLSSENAALRSKIEEITNQQQRDIEDWRNETFKTLRANKVTVGFFKKSGSEYENTRDVSLLRIFTLIAPEMMAEASTEHLAQFLAILLYEQSPGQLRRTWPIPQNNLNSWLFDLASLSLVEPSTRKYSVNDIRSYWTLAEEGKEMFAMIRRALLLKKLDPDPPDSSEGAITSGSDNEAV